MHGHRVARCFLGQMITSPRLSSILMTLRLYGSWTVSLVCLTSSLPLLPELPFPFFRSPIYLSLMPWYPQSDMPYLRCLMCSVPVFNVNCGSPECVHKLHALCTSEATHRPRICLESANCLVVPIRGQVAVSSELSISANASLPREVRAPSPDLLLFAFCFGPSDPPAALLAPVCESLGSFTARPGSSSLPVALLVDHGFSAELSEPLGLALFRDSCFVWPLLS